MNKMFILICLILSILIYVTFQISLDYRRPVYDFPIIRNGSKYILYWDKMWSYDDYGFGFGSKNFQNCRVKNCFTTKDKELMPIDKFDALIFHGVEFYKRIWSNPSKRDPKQVYIYFNMESPFNTPSLQLKMTHSFYNWTLTYR